MTMSMEYAAQAMTVFTVAFLLVVAVALVIAAIRLVRRR